ncbi:arsenate reductase (glutaredoxin) [Asticcacaulis sp. BYS171W]|uniref:Arsenate reductase n=1 Tax=Asticcacaulis aquaticus TaxID=2984212 RepID=A0ABT5HWR7_9CAUL|nr:arsenate reductase (glutaredoxin) [Asticcacaulis aquaticus]MDC7684484.1 arsenate reductase (glutaredoxin) [Asticcacaulis aquaticus]
MSITIYHNPACGTSRNVLAVIEAAGYTPNVVDYLKVGWKAETLLGLFFAAGLTPRQALRETKSPAREMGLLDEGVSNERILAAMLAEPILVNRPFVVTAKGTKLCRPSETVLDVLETWPAGPFQKEDGELMIDVEGHRSSVT